MAQGPRATVQAPNTPTMPHHQAADVCTSPRSLAVNRSQSGSKWLPTFPGLRFHCRYATDGPQHQSQDQYSPGTGLASFAENDKIAKVNVDNAPSQGCVSTATGYSSQSQTRV